MSKMTLNKKSIFIYSALIFFSVMMIYRGTSGNDYINFDDPGYVVKNIKIHQGLTMDNIKWAFTTTHMSNWHPLTWISYMLDFNLFGLNAGKQHLVNVFFHALNSVLFFAFLVLLDSSKKENVKIHAMIALIFALHPLRVESVAWISERKDVLSAFFFFLTLISYTFYVRLGTSRRYIATLACFVLGLLSKPMLVTVPFVLLLLDYWPLKRTGESPVRFSGNLKKEVLFLLKEKIPFFILVFISVFITVYAQRQEGAFIMDTSVFPIFYRVQTIFFAYVQYILLFFMPFKLSVFYLHPGIHLAFFKSFFSFVFIAGVTALCFFQFSRRPWFFTGWLIFLGTLVPVIGLVQVGNQYMADRYTYIPHTGLLLLIWGGLLRLKDCRKNEILIHVIGMFFLVLLSFLTVKQIKYWKNSVTLFSHALEVTPANPVVLNNLGTAFSDSGNPGKAIDYFNEAVKLTPDNYTSFYNLGFNFYKLEKYPEAVYYLKKATEIRKDLPQAYYICGLSYFKLKNYPEAKNCFIENIRYQPESGILYYYMVLCCIGLKQKNETVMYYEKLKSLDPALALKLKVKS